MNQENRNEVWDAYLESVQNGLDYVLRVCKCLQLYIVHIEKVCNRVLQITFISCLRLADELCHC